MKQQLLEAELKNAKDKISLLEEQLRNEVSGKNWRMPMARLLLKEL